MATPGGRYRRLQELQNLGANLDKEEESTDGMSGAADLPDVPSGEESDTAKPKQSVLEDENEEVSNEESAKNSKRDARPGGFLFKNCGEHLTLERRVTVWRSLRQSGPGNLDRLCSVNNRPEIRCRDLVQVNEVSDRATHDCDPVPPLSRHRQRQAPPWPRQFHLLTPSMPAASGSDYRRHRP